MNKMNANSTSVLATADGKVPRQLFSVGDFNRLAKLLVHQDVVLLPEFQEFASLKDEGVANDKQERRHRQTSGLSLVEHWESLGYVLPKNSILSLCEQELTAHAWLHRYVTPILRERLGAHVRLRPMYPNFPRQVMEADEAELLMNALAHYAGDDLGLRILPEYTEVKRKALPEKDKKTRPLRLVTLVELRDVLSSLVSMNTVWSPTQAELATHALPLMLAWNLVGPKNGSPQRENQARLNGAWLKLLGEQRLPEGAKDWPAPTVTTTDILRTAVAYSGGDPSLASSSEKVKFAKLSRTQRRALMSALERAVETTKAPLVDLHTNRQAWLRLGEKLHTGEWRKGMPKAVEAMQSLRNEKAPASWHSRLEALLTVAPEKASEAVLVELLTENPGYTARSLGRLLRWSGHHAVGGLIVDTFSGFADRVDTPLLLALEASLQADAQGPSPRVMLPKGQAAWKYRVPEKSVDVSEALIKSALDVCESSLIRRFSKLPPLGYVYVEPGQEGVLVPKGLRSASESVALATRGSALPVDKNAKVVRLFLWWKDTDTGRVDVDLSAVGLSSDFEHVESCNFQALKNTGLVHSGDFTSAPNGAAEFVDVSLDHLNPATRYVVLTANVFHGPAFSQLPECFVGWQERTSKKAQRGEVMEVSTVVDKFRVTANKKGFVGVAFDVKERKLIWLDFPLDSRTGHSVHDSRAQIESIVEDFLLYASRQPKMSRLIELHMKARPHQSVQDTALADTVFCVAPRLPSKKGQVVIAATQPQYVASTLLVGPSKNTVESSQENAKAQIELQEDLVPSKIKVTKKKKVR